MPPLICPSPTILDQSFPRDDYQLRLVGEALGEIQRVLEEDQAHLIVTETLQLFIEDFDWERTGPYPLLQIIYGLLNQWILQHHDKIIVLDVGDIEKYTPHPVPVSTQLNNYVELWSEEVGKILVRHDACHNQRNFFIGIACDQAFAGYEKGQFENPNNLRAFPLVGPDNLDQLDDAYVWNVPTNIRVQNIPFGLFLNNCMHIGATRVELPKGDSHYHIYFGNYRWQLSCNDDPTPDTYLRELEDIVHLPLSVIKFVILEEHYPEKILRFNM